MSVEKILEFLLKIETEYGNSFFHPEMSVQFKGVVSDYLNGYENAEIRDFVIELHKSGVLAETNIGNISDLKKIVSSFQQKYQPKIKSSIMCPVCNTKNNIKANFCSQCGHMFQKLNNYCPNCKDILSKHVKFCPNCGFMIIKKVDKTKLDSKLIDELITMAEKDSDSEIQELIGDRYTEKKEIRKAFTWYRKSASQGNLSSQCKLANIYISEEKWDDAFRWYKKAADSGFPEGQYQLGIRFFCGEGCLKDKKKAFEWTMKAAKQNHPLAQFHIGDDYFYGKNGEERNYKKAFEWLSKSSCNVDSGRCLYLLGDCYIEGLGTNENKEKAFECYRKSARTGNILGKAKLARCYKNGIGTDVDYDEAFELFSSIRYEKVPAWVLYELGCMYYYGEGCEENEEAGVELWEIAAKKGNHDAKSELDDLEDGESTYYDDDEDAYAKQGSSSEIEINGSWSWSLDDGEFSIDIEEIKNCSHWETGELKLILWYADEPYHGGHLQGEEMGSVFLSCGLSKFDSLKNISETFSCTGNPYSGDYYNVITVNEYHEDGKWYIVGYSNGSSKNHWS